MSEHVIAPAAVQQLCPAFGLLPDIHDLACRRQSNGQSEASTAVPPADIAALHDPSRFDRLWERLLAVVREPVREVRIGETRYVQVCGIAVFAIAANGTITSYLWKLEAFGQSRLDRTPDEAVAVQGMPYGNIWLDLLVHQAGYEVEAEALEQGIAVGDDMAHRYSQWAFDRFRRQLRRHADLRQMRQQIARALCLDPFVLKTAARLPRTTVPAGVILLSAYNRVIRNRPAFESLDREAPNLVPVFGAMCERPGFPSDGEPVARLKRDLMEQTMLSPRAWRMIAKSDGRIFKPLTEFYRDDPDEAAVNHLHFLAMLGLSSASPAWLIRLVLAKWGDTGNRWPSYWTDLWQHAGVWQDVLKMIKDRQPEPTLFAEFDSVHRWITRPGAPRALSKQQRRGGWSLVVRQALRWIEMCERELCDGVQAWDVPFSAKQLDELTLRALRSPFELWEEAQAMRHCVDMYVARCASGKTLVLSVSRGDRRLATAEYERDDEGWVFVTAKGLANLQLPLALEARLRQFPIPPNE